MINVTPVIMKKMRSYTVLQCFMGGNQDKKASLHLSASIIHRDGFTGFQQAGKRMGNLRL